MKKYIIILVFLLLLSLTGGCEPGEEMSLVDFIKLIQNIVESDEEGQFTSALEDVSTDPEDGAEDYLSGDFYGLMTVNDMSNLFASYEFQYSQSNPIQRFDKKCKLSYVGRENINGTMTNKVRIDIDSYTYEDRGQQRDLELEHKHVYDVWYDEAGIPVKTVRDGVTLTGNEEVLAHTIINGNMLGPHLFFYGHYQAKITNKLQLDYLGWQLVNQTSISREIGNGPIKTDVLDFLTADDERMYFEVANVAGKNINIGFYTEFEDDIAGAGVRQFQMTRLVTR